MLPDDDAAIVRGFLVNKFRGDPALFADGMREIARLTEWPALGLIPYFREASRLPAEDALALDGAPAARANGSKPLIAVLGICGGYQMLGTHVSDPEGIAGAPATAAGLGYLDVATVLTGTKALREVSGTSVADGATFTGYEMHVGATSGNGTARPFVHRAGRRSASAHADCERLLALAAEPSV